MTGLIRSEFRKVFTTRLWWCLLIALMAIWAASAFHEDNPEDGYTAGRYYAYLIAMAFGVVTMTGEYRNRTITQTALASPRRGRVVVAKLVVVATVGIGYGLAGLITGVVVGVPTARRYSDRSIDLVREGVPRVGLGVVVAVALWAVIGLGVGTLVRRQNLALLAIWVSLYGVLLFGPVNQAEISDDFNSGKYLPYAATQALTYRELLESVDSPPEMLPWWGAVLTLLAYAAVPGCLGTALTLRRDIT